MKHESEAPMCPAAGYEREDARRDAIVRLLAAEIESTDMHDPMCEAWRESEFPDQVFRAYPSKPAKSATDAERRALRDQARRELFDVIEELRARAVCERAGTFSRSINNSNPDLECTPRDIAEAAPDAIYFMQEGRMP